MAVVTITITDDPEVEGGIHVGMDFDPPLKNNDEVCTPAQVAALIFVKSIEYASVDDEDN